MTECFLSGLIASYILYQSHSISPLIFLPLHLLLWYLVDITLFSYLSPSSPSHSTHTRPPYHDGPSLPFLRAWFVRELLAFPLWLVAMGGEQVEWRDNGERYRLLMSGSVERVGKDVKDGYIDRVVNWMIKRWGTEKYNVLRLDPEDE